jgi:very-short-patch-repair endonuclease
MTESVERRLEKFREKLLDLTRRNRLLNFRATPASTIRIVDELPAEVFRLVAVERRRLGFLAAPARQAGSGGPESPSGDSSEGTPDGPLPPEASELDQERPAAPELEADLDLPQPFQPYRSEELAERHRDDFLQTELEPERLDHNLRRIHHQAASALEEQGFNILFLAIGALEWYETAGAAQPSLAPLILVPVELERRSPRSPFHLRAAEEEPFFNPSLAMKLERELRVTAPELPEELEGFDFQRCLEEVSELVQAQPRWRVLGEIYLSLFSFTKFIMYKDLEASGALFARNRLVRAICGGAEAEARPLHPSSAASSLDELLDPQATFQVLDADSSQQEAIQLVKEGADLVLEGPPGTGKSQTITNIIAECLAAGRRVLFVSEKMAALEVVHARLREAGLADFCLELHSRHASKRQVAEELGRTLALGRDEGEPALPPELSKVKQLRDRLNRHAAALSTPLEPLGINPYEALGRLAALEEAPELGAPLPQAGEWSTERFDEAVEMLRSLEGAWSAVRERFPEPESHPWRGSRLEEVGYETSVTIAAAIDDLAGEVAALESETPALAARIEEEPPSSPAAARQLAHLVRLLSSTPRPEPASARDAAWAAGDEPAALIQLCRRRRDLLALLASRWSPALLGVDLEGLLARRRLAGGLLRFLRPSWWRDRAALNGLLAPGKSLPGRAELIADLERAGEAKACRRRLEDVAERGRRLFGPPWDGDPPDCDALEARAEWMREFHAHLHAGASAGAEAARSERLCALAARGIPEPEAASRAAAALAARLDAALAAWARLRQAARLDEKEAFGGPFLEQPFSSIRARLEEMGAHREALQDWTRQNASEAACERLGLGAVIAAARRRRLPHAALVSAFQRLFLMSWLDHAFKLRPELRQFSRQDHERLIGDFRELDLEQLRLARSRLRSRLLARLPDGSWEPSARSELGLLKREVRRKRGHLPLRKLFQTMPRATAQLKPCFLMSPLSVAQFIDPRAMRFDVVVFDEASQIAPEDAIGAIARGGQLVVVGDSRQLPPTTFFQGQGLLSDAEAAGEETAADLESILDECAAANFPRRMLRWHYRSRHESLIAFSNAHFYERLLNTFPSSSAERERLGVELIYIPEAVYERGKGQRNLVEAERVAREVLAHFRTHPELSLGVGTFSQAQQLAIIDRLEALRREDESFEELFAAERPEHFFVKNLENLQGDERDVIFLSVGYGRDAAGRLHLNFGPLNKTGGERRLNVLVTRARRRLAIFSSIRSSDIAEARAVSAGARLLKRYLEYAEGGLRIPGFEPPVEGAARSGGSFEDALAERLSARGLAIERRLGTSASRIDLAVRDPELSGRYLLAIECDGGSYQACRTARDRDRLRQQVLEGLGWRLHRTWSVEWLRNPRQEIERAVEAVAEARRGKKAPEVLPLLEKLRPALPRELPVEAPKEPTEPAAAVDAGTLPDSGALEPAGAAVPSALPPYRLAALSPAGEPEELEGAGEELVSRLIEAVSVEAPLHIDEAARRVAACWGITRLSRTVERQVTAAAGRAASEGRLRIEGEFLWRPDGEAVTPRHRGGEGVPREPELIALEEIAAAARLVLEREFRLAREDLISQVARLLGFLRTGARLRERIGLALDRLVGAGEALEEEGKLSLSR